MACPVSTLPSTVDFVYAVSFVCSAIARVSSTRLAMTCAERRERVSARLSMLHSQALLHTYDMGNR